MLSKEFYYFLAGFAFASAIYVAFFLGQMNGGFPLPSHLRSVSASSQQQIHSLPQTPTSTIKSADESVPQQTVQELSPDVLFAKTFEDFLNGFLGQLTKNVRDYKKDRRILKEVLNSFNLEGTSNIEKSYKVFREEIAPMLRKKRHDIIDIFKREDERILVLLEKQPKQTQEKIIKQWKDIKNEHLSGLIDFFELEEQLIQAHEKILKFYFVHSKLFRVDLQSGKIIFSQEKYRMQETELLKDIEDIRSRQKN